MTRVCVNMLITDMTVCDSASDFSWHLTPACEIMDAHSSYNDLSQGWGYMDIKRYAAFVAAVDTKSMSGAAKQLGYTPSGIIRLINTLEAELGFPVLVRSSSGVAPTPEGEKMLPLFREMTRLDEQTQQTSARIRGLAEGTLTIGALFGIASLWLPAVIREYQDCFPGVKVNVVEASDTRLGELLEQHYVDCCIFHGDHSKLNWTPLGCQELVAWLPKSSPLTRHSALLLAELDGQPYIRIHPEDRTVAIDLLESKGIEPDVRFTTGSCHTAFKMVAANLGFSLCCNGIADSWDGDVAIMRLSPRRFIEFGLATLQAPGPSPAVEEFARIAVAHRDTWPRD